MPLRRHMAAAEGTVLASPRAAARYVSRRLRRQAAIAAARWSPAVIQSFVSHLV